MLNEENKVLKIKLDISKEKLTELRAFKKLASQSRCNKLLKMLMLDMAKLTEVKKSNRVDYNQEVRDSTINESDIVTKKRNSILNNL